MSPSRPWRSLRQSASSWARAAAPRGCGAAHTSDPSTGWPAMPCSAARLAPLISRGSTSSQRRPSGPRRQTCSRERQQPWPRVSPAALRPSRTTSMPSQLAPAASSTVRFCSSSPPANSTSSWGSHSRSLPASRLKCKLWRAHWPCGTKRERPTVPYTFWAATLVSRAWLPGSRWARTVSWSPPTRPPAVCRRGNSQRPSAWG